MRTELSLGALRERLLLERRAGFERSVIGLTLLGAAAAPVTGLFSRPSGPWVAVVLAQAALLLAGIARADEPVKRAGERWALCLTGAVATWVFGPLVGALVTAALLGVALQPGGSWQRLLLAPLALAASLAWGLAVTHRLERWELSTLPPLARAVVGGATLGLLTGMGVMVLHLRWVDLTLSRLLRARGTAKVSQLYQRCLEALSRSPAPVLHSMLADVALEGGALSSALEAAQAALGRVSRKEAEEELARVRATLSDAGARSRSGLASAAQAWSDALEHLDSLECARERLDANLRARTAFLERAALGLETTGPGELGSLAERLAAQRPEPLAASARG